MTTFSERALLWIVSRNPVYSCSSIQCLRENLQSEGKKQPKVVDSSAQITKITPSTRIVVWLLYQYKSNLSSLLYKFYTQKPFEPSLVTMARGALRDGFG